MTQMILWKKVSSFLSILFLKKDILVWPDFTDIILPLLPSLLKRMLSKLILLEREREKREREREDNKLLSAQMKIS